MRVAVFYFTGTGNTEHAARAFRTAFAPDHPTDLYNVENLRQFEPRWLAEYDLLGFCAPVYGFAVPLPFHQFLSRLPRAPGRRAFLLVTAGGAAAGATAGPSAMLKRRGFDVVCELVVIMPANVFVSARSGDVDTYKLLGLTGDCNVPATLERCEIRVRAAAASIVGGERTAVRVRTWERVLSTVCGPIVRASSWQMLLQLRVTAACNQCGLCIRSCPRDNIRLTRHRVRLLLRCAMCLRCLNICPNHAIRMVPPMSLFDNRVQYTCPGWSPPSHPGRV